ncbi:MAG: hypothetical protein ACYDB9_02075 [Gammaproteobacteria bacterium]
MNPDIQHLCDEIALLKLRTIPLCEGLQEEYSRVQQRADDAYRAVGCDGAPLHLSGESLTDYRHRLLRGLQGKSPTWRGVQLPRAADALAAIEPQILRDAVASLRDSANYGPGQLKEVVERDATGRRITKFYGDNSVTWSPFQPRQIAYVTGFSQRGGK